MSSTHHFIQCPDCSQAYRIRFQLLSSGRRVRCRRCGSSFELQVDIDPLSIWLFVDDPAFARQGVVAHFEHPFHQVEMLDGAARRALLALDLKRLPDAVIFGDMHVILEDALLAKVAAQGATRVLVSTHRNEELLQSADSFCGHDHHLVLPIEAALVDLILTDVLERRLTHA